MASSAVTPKEKQTWYVIERYYFRKDFPGIVPMIVLKETDKMVVVEEKSWRGGSPKERRVTKDSNMFRTKAEAEAELTRRLADDVTRATEKLARAKAALEKWFMREVPDVQP